MKIADHDDYHRGPSVEFTGDGTTAGWWLSGQPIARSLVVEMLGEAPTAKLESHYHDGVRREKSPYPAGKYVVSFHFTNGHNNQ